MKRIQSTLLAIVYIAVFTTLLASPIAQDNQNNDKQIVDQLPIFQSDVTDFSDINAYFDKHLTIPTSFNDYLNDKVIQVSVLIESTGEVYDIEPILPIHPEVYAELISAITEMPDWKPAMKDGKPVAYLYILTGRFEKHEGKARLIRYVENVPQYINAEEENGEENFKFEASERIGMIADILKLKVEKNTEVSLDFTVSTDGYFADVVVKKGLGTEADKLIKTQFEAWKAWVPASDNGKIRNFRDDETFFINETEASPFANQEVDQLPRFGSKAKDLQDFFNKEYKYPNDLPKNSPKRTVQAKFMVNGFGEVKDAVITDSLSKKANKELLKVIEKMPNWRPALVDNVPTDFEYLLTLRLGKEKNDPLFIGPEKLPEFPGGRSEMGKYLGEKMKPISKALNNRINRRVIVRFMVSATGEITEVKLQESIDPEIDYKIERMFKDMPTWSPAELQHRPLGMWQTAPLMFKGYQQRR